MTISDFLSGFTNYPVLFVGTGISLRYFENSYSWDSLLQTIVRSYNSEEEHYLDLKARCTEGESSCNYSKLATLIEAEFNLVAENNRNGQFKSINDEFYQHMRNGKKYSRFKLYISELFSSLTLKKDVDEEIEMLRLASKNISSVITTNYDCFIEKAFEFTPLIGNDILLSNPYGSVYKIHGCVSHPGDIIITDEDYKKFNHRYELLNAQLLSLFIHNPIIFIGYSVTDPDIKRLLKTIFTYVEPNTDLAKRIRNNFLLVDYSPGSDNLNVVEHDVDIEGVNSTIRINRIKTDRYIDIYKSLSELTLPVSAMDIRKVQMIVKEIYAGGSIRVEIIEDIDKMKNHDKILAIGSSKSIQYHYLSTKDMIRKYFDIMDKGDAAPLTLINKPRIADTQFFPVMGFSTLSSSIDDVARLKRIQKQNVDNYLSSTCRFHLSRHTSVLDILNDNTIARTYKYMAIMASLSEGMVSLEDVESFLRSRSDTEKVTSDYRRLLSLYDILKYGPRGRRKK